MIRVIAMTQKGSNKIENEDRIVIGKSVISTGAFQKDNISGFVAIADGVGGNKAGNIAADFVTNQVSKLDTCSKENFVCINNHLIANSKQNQEWNKMATTLSGVFISDNSILGFHIGNTRVYSVQGGKYLKQLTEDDTTMSYLLKTGHLSHQDALNFANKNEITACFGACDDRLFNFKIFDINKNSSYLFLLTSDGIHDYVNIDELENIICEGKNEMDICDAIMKKALLNNSTDDMSVVIIHCNEEENKWD